MNTKLNSLAAFTAMVCISGPASAAVETHVTGHLTRLQIGLSAGAYIYIDSSLAALNCTPGEGTNVLLEYTHTRFKDIYATLLAAKTSAQEVTLRIQEATEGCKVMYITIN